MKRLVRLYPRHWRERYGAEIEALLERRRVTPTSVLDLVRGIVDAHLHPHLAAELVFVPEIGFRPGGTRVLLERAETEHDDAVVTVLAVAAAPDRTDVVLEWESHRDTAIECETPSPERRLETGPDQVAFANLVVPGTDYEPASTKLGLRAFVTRRGWSVRTITFPPLPASTDRAEIRISDGQTEWRVPFGVAVGRVGGAPVRSEVERHGIVVRALAAARQGDEAIVELEAHALDEETRLGRIGASPPPLLPPGVKPPRSWGRPDDALAVEDDHGRRAFERRRIHSQDSAPPARIGVSQRFTSVFGPIDPDVDRLTLTVPTIEINELGGAVEIDVRALPVDAQIGPHRFSVVRAEPSQFGAARRRFVIDAVKEAGPRCFVRPHAVHGRQVPGDYAWGEDDEGTIWMDTAVGDPPVMSFAGAALEVAGPWTLTVSLS